MRSVSKLQRVPQSISGGEEGPVEPTTTLRDELGDGVGHVRLSLSALDVLEHPGVATLGHKLPAENAILLRASWRSVNGLNGRATAKIDRELTARYMLFVKTSAS